MPWAKPKIYYNTGITALTATPLPSTNYPVSNLIDGYDGTLWKAPDTTTQVIKHDAGVGNTHTFDFLAIVDHNFASAKPNLTLAYSSDDITYTTSLSIAAASALYDDPMILQEFTQRAYRFQKLTLSNCLVAPQMAICYWGKFHELDYVDVSFSPDATEIKANINITETGFLSGVHEKYTERSMELKWEDMDDAFYQVVKTFIETVGLLNFVIAWELTSHPSEIFLMRREPGRFAAPLKFGGARRDVTLSLIGRSL